MTTAWRLEDLVIWQLAVQLRDEIIQLTNSGRVVADRDFREQIRDSASSVPRNVAEGFGLFQPRLFAKHLRLARGSLFETKNHLVDGNTRKYFSDDDTERLTKLTARTFIAATRLIAYLDSCEGEAPTGWGRGSGGSRGSKGSKGSKGKVQGSGGS